MAALDAKTVNAKSVETVKLNCIQKVSSANNKRLCVIQQIKHCLFRHIKTGLL